MYTADCMWGNYCQNTNWFCFRAKHAQTELKKKQSELKKTEKDYSKDKVLFDDIQKNIKKLEVL